MSSKFQRKQRALGNRNYGCGPFQIDLALRRSLVCILKNTMGGYSSFPPNLGKTELFVIE